MEKLSGSRRRLSSWLSSSERGWVGFRGLVEVVRPTVLDTDAHVLMQKVRAVN